MKDWIIGNDIRFKTDGRGKIFEQWEKVLHIRQNKLIKYNLFAPRPDVEDKPENDFIMSYVLTANNDKTKLEIIQTTTGLEQFKKSHKVKKIKY